MSSIRWVMLVTPNDPGVAAVRYEKRARRHSQLRGEEEDERCHRSSVVVAVYVDRGITEDMFASVLRAEAARWPVEYRTIEDHCLTGACCPRPCRCECETCS
jgi:hypothetical protein